MNSNPAVYVQKELPTRRSSSLIQRIWKHKMLFLMLLPGFAIILVFNYGPMYGIQIAFKDYRILDGIWGSQWVGLKYFYQLFATPSAMNSWKNTLLISLYRQFWGFAPSIIIALMFNEVGNKIFKSLTQTISYLPHFINWIIISGMITSLLSPNYGLVNHFIKALGFEPIYFMTNTGLFRSLLVATDIWKELGWGSILLLAALSNVDPQQIEAAIVEGANRLQRIRYILLPAMVPIIIIGLILSMGFILNAGFDQIFNMYNLMVYSVADIIDTYVYRIGLKDMNYSFSTAVGLFKSVVGLILMLIVNLISKNVGKTDAGLF